MPFSPLGNSSVSKTFAIAKVQELQRVKKSLGTVGLCHGRDTAAVMAVKPPLPGSAHTDLSAVLVWRSLLFSSYPLPTLFHNKASRAWGFCVCSYW